MPVARVKHCSAFFSSPSQASVSYIFIYLPMMAWLSESLLRTPMEQHTHPCAHTDQEADLAAPRSLSPRGALARCAESHSPVRSPLSPRLLGTGRRLPLGGRPTWLGALCPELQRPEFEPSSHTQRQGLTGDGLPLIQRVGADSRAAASRWHGTRAPTACLWPSPLDAVTLVKGHLCRWTWGWDRRLDGEKGSAGS